jgi:hypothetical protein
MSAHLSRAPLPEAQPNRHHPNELDRFLKKMRLKYMHQIAHKCNKLPNTEFKLVIEEFQNIFAILSQIEQEVFFSNFLTYINLTGLKVKNVNFSLKIAYRT